MELIQWNTSPSKVKTLGLFSQRKMKKKSSKLSRFSCTLRLLKTQWLLNQCVNAMSAPGFQTNKGNEKNVVNSPILNNLERQTVITVY